jgi:hypothetical protein
VNKRTLVIAVLKTRSSFQQKREEPAAGSPDTLQWWLTPEHSWRIRTFAIDRDIHVHRIDGGDLGEFLTNTKKNFGDSLEVMHTLDFSNFEDPAVVREAFHQVDVEPNLEISRQGFAFWNPDKGHYHTQSTP